MLRILEISIICGLLFCSPVYADEIEGTENEEYIEYVEESGTEEIGPGFVDNDIETSFDDSVDTDNNSDIANVDNENDNESVNVESEEYSDVSDGAVTGESDIEAVEQSSDVDTENPVHDSDLTESELETLSAENVEIERTQSSDVEGTASASSGSGGAPSGAGEYIPHDGGGLQSQIDLYEDLLSTEGTPLFESELNLEDLTDWDLATYYKAVLTNALVDLLGMPDEESDEESDDEEPLIADDFDFKLMKEGILERALPTQSAYKNVVVFHGIFNGYDCDLVIPYDSYKYLTVQNGILINVGSSAVTGKILYDGDILDPAEYDSYVYTLQPIYGSTTNVFNYGSFNYRRHYYVTAGAGGDRITYQDMYGNFTVDDVDVYMSSGERVYYLLLIMLIFGGISHLWTRRH